MAGKGKKCPECNKSQAVEERGANHCKNPACGAIWWSPFAAPTAGQSRKGYECTWCARQTVHPIGIVGSAKIWRCSTCAATLVAPVPA